jgi:hypothetical protein
MNEENSVEEGFYNQVAEILGIDSNYKPFPYSKKTRWNNRSPGNGRFNGYGIVRWFSSSQIHVQLYNPKISGLFASEELALIAINKSIL